MTVLLIILLLLYGFAVGVFLGYIIWAPETVFKQSVIDRLILKFIWGRFFKGRNNE
jgi:hypothetical protein